MLLVNSRVLSYPYLVICGIKASERRSENQKRVSRNRPFYSQGRAPIKTGLGVKYLER